MFNRSLIASAGGILVNAATIYSDGDIVVTGYADNFEGLSGGSVTGEPWETANIRAVYSLSYGGTVDITIAFDGDVATAMLGLTVTVGANTYVIASATDGPTYRGSPNFCTFAQFVNVGAGHALAAGNSYSILVTE